MFSFNDAEETSASPAAAPADSGNIVFDIETAPAWQPGDSVDAAREYCLRLGIEYDPASIGEHPGEFDTDAVKIGNLKDAKKIEAKIEDARRNHAVLVEVFNQKAADGEPAFFRSMIGSASLSPVTGRVIAVGYKQAGGEVELELIEDDVSETVIIESFWRRFETCRMNSAKLVGWNIEGFDVPFLVWRSAVNGVEIPPGVYRGKWLSDTFCDLMNRWPSLWNPWKQTSGWLKAEHAARFLGCSRPDDEIEGKHFWRNYFGTDEQRALAVRYLMNDVTEEFEIARALGEV